MSVLTLIVTLALAEPASTITAQAPALRDIECYCTDASGQRIEMGDMICLNVGGRQFTARCEMSLNNPMWREVSDGCFGV